MNRNTLGSNERLKSEKSITALFETGKILSVFPVRLIYKFHPTAEKFPVKVGFAVPKKNFKHAVDRNLLKRRMREAYRLNKNLLVKDEKDPLPGLDIMLIYQGNKPEELVKITSCIKELLKKLSLKVPAVKERLNQE